MEQHRTALAHLVARILNRSGSDAALGFKRILRLLNRWLSLEEATVFLLDPSGKNFSRQIRGRGHDHFIPCSLGADVPFHGKALDTRRPMREGACLCCPLYSGDRRLGILVLTSKTSAPVEEEWIPSLSTLCQMLSMSVRHLLSHTACETGMLDQFRVLSEENDRKWREMTVLYHLSRTMHSTLRLNELMHLILSAATLPGGGGFGQAMLFMVNERTGAMQGMLGIGAKAASLVFPDSAERPLWESPRVDASVLHAQKETSFCRQVQGLRLSLGAGNSVAARAVVEGRVMVYSRWLGVGAEDALADALHLDSYACAPLAGDGHPLAALIVEGPGRGEFYDPSRLRFLELFANQAGSAMENSLLMNRLETAHRDLKEAQERLLQGEKMAVLGEMSASVAHELRNPLVLIGGYAKRLARMTHENGPEHDYAEIIARETLRMEKILENILAFSKKHMLCFADCRMVDVLHDALELERDTLEKAGVAVVMEIRSGLPSLKGDDLKLRQVVLNLIANARQAMTGGGTLYIRARLGHLRGDQCMLVEVEDTGGGISCEVLRNIFNPFFSTKEAGTGLGLSISHRIIELHGGEITVENREKGARFTLRLPFKAAAPPEASPFH